MAARKTSIDRKHDTVALENKHMLMGAGSLSRRLFVLFAGGGGGGGGSMSV